MIMLRGFSAFQAECCVIAAISPHKEVGLRFRSEFFNIFNHPKFGNPKIQLAEPPVRALDANSGEQPWLQWREWRFQPSLPDRRTALDPVGA